jgi:nitroimidazol reductase NimA-like FMN-containing flavoprotein (pyridoxamine 5'-phosphate oxidase superfamily)
MEYDRRTGVEVLDDDTSWELVTSRPVGRLAASVAGRVELWPVNFAVEDRAIYIRSEDGTKLAAVGGTDIVFEVDSVSDQFEVGWSVIARGCLEELTDVHAVAKAERLQLRTWSPTGKPHWLRLVPAELSGRRITKVAGFHTD